MPAAAAAAGCAGTGGAGLRAQFPQSGRDRRRLRQERRWRRTPCCGSASASSRSAPSRRARRPAIRVRACSGWRPTKAVINRLGFNNDGAAAVLTRLAARAGAGGIVGVNIGANSDTSRPRRRLCPADRDLRAGGELFHRQRLLAQHARPARSAAGARRLTTCWRACIDARDRVRAARRSDAGAAQDRARPDARRSRRRRRRRAQAPRRRHDRRQHDHLAPGLAARAEQARRSRRPVRQAAVQALDPRCWRKPLCAPKARFR